MNAERRVQLWGQIVAAADGDPVSVVHVCTVAVSAGGVDSAALAVTLRASPRETLYASDQVASELEELAMTLGEGPGIDALTGGTSLIADLTTPSCLRRWPAFAPAAATAGIRAVFALPLQVGGVRLGVLDLYRASPGELGRDQLADGLLLADTACALLLDSGQASTPDLADRYPEQAAPHHPEVHQATGMMSVQMAVSVADALIRLRAYAYAHEMRLRDVAADVVGRRLRFNPGDDNDD
jgi:hypothetical protein